jgi:hypothetical protein
MPGAIIIAVIILVLIPVSICMSGGIIAAILGWALKENGETENEGSELIDLNK